jgi:hypothetical protein
MAPPRAVIVPQVMIWICGVNPRTIFGEFMMFSPVSSASGTLGKTKTAHPSGRRFQSSGGDFIQRVSSPHIVGNFRFRPRAP